jgi:hypothetical protein
MISVVQVLPPRELPNSDAMLEATSNLVLRNIKDNKEPFYPEWDGMNKMEVSNYMGEKMFYAYDNSSACCRAFCEKTRPFTIHITDQNNKEVIRLVRDCKCCNKLTCRQWFASCSKCCANEIVVESPPGVEVGRIRQTGSFWRAHYELMDKNGQTKHNLVGPCINSVTRATFNCLGRLCDGCDTAYTMTNAMTGQVEGTFDKTVEKKDFKQIANFPVELSKDDKVMTLATMFLLELLYFEKNTKQHSECWGVCNSKDY